MAAPSLTKSRFRIGGMDCAACATKIETAVRRLPGITEVNVSATAQTMTIAHAEERFSVPEVERAVTNLGYSIALLPSHSIGREKSSQLPAHGTADHGHGQGDGTWWRGGKGRITIVCGVAFALAWAAGVAVPGSVPWGFIFAMTIGLVPIARRALAAARAGQPFSIETLMTIAAVGAVFIDAAEEAAAVVFLFLVGELLEGVAAGRARSSITALTELVPRTALLENAGQLTEVLADRLAVGAMILVRPGDRIPSDGEIVSGASAIDEAPVTGESVPKRKREGDAVFAGTVNLEGALRIRVSAAAADNTIARIVRLVEEAQEAKAPTERLIDRFSKFYTPGVLALGALVATAPPLLFGGAWASWIYKGLAILLVGCPCALVISTPAAIAAGLANGARRGLLMKGGAVLEQIGRVTMMAFDKTGTLTLGRPMVTDIVPFGDSERGVLTRAAALEMGSSHPLAQAILTKAAQAGIDVKPAEDAAALAGKGVTGRLDGKEVFLGSPDAAAERVPLSGSQQEAVARLNGEGKTVAVLVVAQLVAGAIAMRDEPRPDAKAGLAALADRGIATVMLTGDDPRVAAAIGETLGVRARAGLLPADKQRIVADLQAQGYKVAKVGDGINDAPALAAADIGIAMGGGTDVALETADGAVLHGRVADIAAMVDLSRRTMANIRQNISIALGLKAVFLVTTLAGLTGLWPAILADTGATVLVTANALRLLHEPRAWQSALQPAVART